MTKAANRIKQKKNSADWSINLKLQNIRFSFANFIIFFLNTGNKFMFSLDELLITLAMRFNWFLRNRQFRCICCELETSYLLQKVTSQCYTAYNKKTILIIFFSFFSNFEFVLSLDLITTEQSKKLHASVKADEHKS